MNEIKEYTDKIFEDIKHIDENGDFFEIRPIFSDTETVIPVKDQVELEVVYFQKTGNNISIETPNYGKRM